MKANARLSIQAFKKSSHQKKMVYFLQGYLEVNPFKRLQNMLKKTNCLRFVNLGVFFLALFSNNSCEVKKNNHDSGVFQANQTEDPQARLAEFFKYQLESWFLIGSKQIDTIGFEKKIEKILPSQYVKDREKVLEAIVTSGLKETERWRAERKGEFQGVQLEPELVLDVVRQSLMLDYSRVTNPTKNTQGFVVTKRSPVLSRFALLPNEVIPFMSRLITKKIRQTGASAEPTEIMKMLGAVPLSPGSVRDIVFSSLQRKYPQMALSSKINDVYIVAEFHQKTIESIFLDRQAQVNHFLTVENIRAKFPHLQRIEAALPLLENFISNVRFEPGLNGMPPISVVITDPFQESVVKGLNRLIKEHPNFFPYVRSIGFTGAHAHPEKPERFWSPSLQTLMTPSASWSPKELEVDTALLEESDIPGLRQSRLGIIIFSKKLEDAYFKALQEIDSYYRGTLFTESCNDKLMPLKEEAYFVKAEASYIANQGLVVSFTEATKSALMVAP
jgi:hypothetical protein